MVTLATSARLTSKSGQPDLSELSTDTGQDQQADLQPPEIDFRSSPSFGHSGQSWERPLLTQAVWKLFFGDQDEILIREVGLSRNNDSPTLPSGFNCCAEGLGICVFTQPGPKAELTIHRWNT